jgi:hypothetical protein
MCDGRNHNLIMIFKGTPAFDEDPYPVVRWCEDCGAIVVDREVDGRLAGRIEEMRFPKLTYSYFRESL